MIFFFARIVPAEIGIGRLSKQMSVYVVIFGLLFAGALIRVTYSMIKHRHDDEFFDRLPPE